MMKTFKSGFDNPQHNENDHVLARNTVRGSNEHHPCEYCPIKTCACDYNADIKDYCNALKDITQKLPPYRYPASDPKGEFKLDKSEFDKILSLLETSKTLIKNNRQCFGCCDYAKLITDDFDVCLKSVELPQATLDVLQSETHYLQHMIANARKEASYNGGEHPSA